jgi:hypothetical protein
MNLPSSSETFFAKWFELLAKHRFGGALLPVAGISIGYFLVLSSHVMPSEFATFIGFLGSAMLTACILLFLAFAVIHLYRLARTGSMD